MKKFKVLLSILLMLTMAGCSNNLSSRFGEVDENKYINKYYGFTMEIPTGYQVVKDVKKLNGSEVGEDAEELIIFSARELNDSKEISNETNSKGITVLVLNKNKNALQFAQEMHNNKSGSESLNSISILNKYIKGQEYAVLEYKDGEVFYTDWNDKIIEFNFVNYEEDMIKIDETIKTVVFE